MAIWKHWRRAIVRCMALNVAARLRNSSCVILPMRRVSELIRDCSARMRVASCSEDISSEKKPMTAPSTALGRPSGPFD